VWLRFCGLPERLALRAGQIEPVAVVVVQAHAGGCRGGSFLHLLFSRRHRDGSILSGEQFTYYARILGKLRPAVNGKAVLPARVRVSGQTNFTENYLKLVRMQTEGVASPSAHLQGWHSPCISCTSRAYTKTTMRLPDGWAGRHAACDSDGLPVHAVQGNASRSFSL
jgi:hypothetical protein